MNHQLLEQELEQTFNITYNSLTIISSNDYLIFETITQLRMSSAENQLFGNSFNSSSSHNKQMLNSLNKANFDKAMKEEFEEKNMEHDLQLDSQIKENHHSQPKIEETNFDDRLLEIQKEIAHNALHCKTFSNSKWDTFAPYSFVKLSSQQKDNTFQKLYESFQKLKRQHNDYMEKYSKLSVRLHKLERGKKVSDRNLNESPDHFHSSQKLKEENKRLLQKIAALTTNSEAKKNTRPKTSTMGKSSAMNKTSGQKSIFPATQNIKAELQVQKKHVKELLLVIDDLKRNKLMSDSHMRDAELDRKIKNLPPGSRGNNPKAQRGFNQQEKFREYSDQIYLLKEKCEEKDLCYNQMCEEKDKIIRELNQQNIELRETEKMKRNMERNNRPSFQVFGQEERIRELEDSNEKLQREVKSLLSNALFKGDNMTIDLKKKNNELQESLRKLKKQESTYRESNSQLLADIQYKTKQNKQLKAQNEKFKRQIREQMEKGIERKAGSDYKYDENDFYRKLLNMVHLEGNDPVWKKYNDLILPAFNTLSQEKLRETCEELWKSKLQLLAHLEKAQIELRINKQTNESRINSYIRDNEALTEELRVARAQVDEFSVMDRVNANNRDFQVYESKGVKYSDSVEVFEDDQDEIKALDHNENYFDLFLGQLNLDQFNLLKHPQNKIKIPSSIISFLTIDFYNHPTQNSNFAEGVNKKLLNNFSFKVEVNEYLIKYLTRNSITLQLWSPQGTSTILFGKGQIHLTELVAEKGRDVSNVLRGKCPIYTPGKALIGTIEYRIRMRLPISSFLHLSNAKKIMNKSQGHDPFAINQRKVLAIDIERAENLQDVGNTFVYFTVQNEDFFTEPESGSNPFWDFHREINVILDEDFCAFLKQNYVQFTLFDDDKEVNEDVVGTAKANFTPLLEGKEQLNLELEIFNSKNHYAGKLKVKARWT